MPPSRLILAALFGCALLVNACSGASTEVPNDPGGGPAPVPADVDTDGDGVPNSLDAFPDDANEQVDTDGDGVGDNGDVAPADPTRSVPPIRAVRRGGQTFLTWEEDAGRAGERYHVYRHDAPITTANLADATRLTDRWGALPEGTAIHPHALPGDPQRFVIQDLGSPLPAGTGLFVYTTQAGDSGQAWYAVTEIVGGVEDTDIVTNVNTLGVPVAEAVQPARAVLVRSRNGGRGRLYTQFMDVANWNPTLSGYAYNYAVGLPDGFDPATPYPVKIELHAYGERYRNVDEAEYDWPAIHVLPDDPGGVGTSHTWWYGFARDHDYRAAGTTPTAGPVVNFTEQRVLAIVDDLVRDPGITVDTSRTHVWGHSMGASGSLSLGVRYGDVFAAIYGSQPMTDYRSSPTFIEEFERLWGTRAANLPILNAGPHSQAIARYGQGGDRPSGVWDWMDHGAQLVRRRGERFAFLAFGHGKADTTIDWATQGRPFIASLDAARAAFSSLALAGYGHNWMGFEPIVHSVFSAGYGDWGNFVFRNTLTYPALHRASGSGPLVPPDTGTDRYNLDIDWSTPWNAFGAAPVDTSARYEITLRSLTVEQTADVTPRNTSAFRPAVGQAFRWRVQRADNGQVLQQGSTTADADGLVTVTGARILTGAGSRLIIEP